MCMTGELKKCVGTLAKTEYADHIHLPVEAESNADDDRQQIPWWPHLATRYTILMKIFSRVRAGALEHHLQFWIRFDGWMSHNT